MSQNRENRKIWAEKQLVKFQPYDEWLAAKPRSEEEKKLYWKSFDHLLAIAEGDEGIMGDLVIISGDGKTVLVFDE